MLQHNSRRKRKLPSSNQSRAPLLEPPVLDIQSDESETLSSHSPPPMVIPMSGFQEQQQKHDTNSKHIVSVEQAQSSNHMERDQLPSNYNRTKIVPVGMTAWVIWKFWNWETLPFWSFCVSLFRSINFFTFVHFVSVSSLLMLTEESCHAYSCISRKPSIDLMKPHSG